MFLPQTLLSIGRISISTHSKNDFGDDCGKGKNPNKELFLPIEYYQNNIVWPDKPNIFFTQKKS